MSAASSIVAIEWVAPSRKAAVRFISTGSTAMMTEAPAWAAPCTALMPIPFSDSHHDDHITGLTSAELTAEPHPVLTPQLVRQAAASGMSDPGISRPTSPTPWRTR